MGTTNNNDMSCTASGAMVHEWYATATHTAMVVGSVVLLLVLTLLFLIKRPSPPKLDDETKKRRRLHAIITGGSSGIGLSLAKECLGTRDNYGDYQFSHITLVARNGDRLEAARTGLSAFSANVRPSDVPTVIQTVSADVSDYAALDRALRPILDDDVVPPPDVLFNVAGTAVPVRFLESEPQVFADLVRTNYLGTVYATRIVVPRMLRDGGTVVLTSSAAGQVGVYGYSAYTPTKFALRGLAEVLSMELAPFSVKVQLVFPPNTATPGFDRENDLKMEECKLMEDSAGLLQPEDVARKMLREATRRNPPFLVYFGLEGWMLSTLTSGMSAVHTLFDAFCQITLTSLLRFVSLFYLRDFRNIVERCHRKRQQQQEGCEEERTPLRATTTAK